MVLYTLGLISFLMFGALAIDVGYWYAQKAKFQMTMDAVAIAALGTVTRGATVKSQETYIASTVNTIATANGYASGQFTPTYHVTPSSGPNQWVDQVTLTGSQTLTTWMWHVFNVNTITLHGFVKAEDDANPFVGCSFMTQNSNTFAGASNSNRMEFDSYDSTKAAYNPVNNAFGWGSLYDNNQVALCADNAFTFNNYTVVYGSVGAYANGKSGNTGLTFRGNNGKALNYVSADAMTLGSIAGKTSKDYIIDGAVLQKQAGITKYTTTCPTWNPSLKTVNDNATQITCSSTINVTDCNTIITGETPANHTNKSPNGPNPWPPSANATVTFLVKSGGTNIYCDNWTFNNLITIDIVNGSGVVSPANAVTLWVDGSSNPKTGLALSGSLQFDPANPGTAQDFYVFGNDTLAVGKPPITFGITSGRASDKLYAYICSNNSLMTLPANIHYFGAFFVNSFTDPVSDDFTYDEAVGPVGLGSDPVIRGTHLVD